LEGRDEVLTLLWVTEKEYVRLQTRLNLPHDQIHWQVLVLEVLNWGIPL